MEGSSTDAITASNGTVVSWRRVLLDHVTFELELSVVERGRHADAALEVLGWLPTWWYGGDTAIDQKLYRFQRRANWLKELSWPVANHRQLKKKSSPIRRRISCALLQVFMRERMAEPVRPIRCLVVVRKGVVGIWIELALSWRHG